MRADPHSSFDAWPEHFAKRATALKKVKAVHSASWENHLRATGRHMGSHSVTCMAPDTSERAPP